MKKQNDFYGRWWFWFFMTIIFLALCFSFVSCELGSQAIDKGEYKIIFEAGDNFKAISENIEQSNVPVTCACSCPQTPHYCYLNQSLWNWSNWDGDFSPYWVKK